MLSRYGRKKIQASDSFAHLPCALQAAAFRGRAALRAKVDIDGAARNRARNRVFAATFVRVHLTHRLLIQLQIEANDKFISSGVNTYPTDKTSVGANDNLQVLYPSHMPDEVKHPNQVPTMCPWSISSRERSSIVTQ
ncbi:uncharacterized protein LOC105186957 [Harpegnathos saltator]|uniref:uncharacterized protein LOC105186957 n=1 Tax=Harpegnathos saltator TaxID=610380 RepID=UPI000DBED7D9|nr:uncharacterized protein LOC105186957 [Harpegnathos saltator]